jgi:alpha-L-fucosidase
MKYVHTSLMLALATLVTGPLAAQQSVSSPNPNASPETAAQRAERMQWWHEARFGMFIHWGAYAQLAGVWDGKPIDAGVGNGIGEWIMYNAKVPVADYARVAADFNPVEFDADAWVRIAREAGQKYIIITSKHHDGFALFDSKASPFNIVQHTPFKRDVLKELADACKKHDVKLGFYYSQAQDWHHPGGAAYKTTFAGGEPGEGRWDSAQAGDFDEYLDQIAIPQVRELLTHYGPVSVFWWDTPVGMTTERARRLAPLLSLQPGIITNNRLLNDRGPSDFPGDTDTPEQTIPPTGFKDRNFEVCMTMNDTWGYKKNDENWKSSPELIRKLVDVASKGGNFLLNVGPDALGRIPAPSIERLQAVGRWMRVNDEAIYGTTASPFAKLPWGRCTQKPGVLYLHVFDWPKDGRLYLPGLKSPIASADLLAGGEALRVDSKEGVNWIHLPSVPPDPVASVIRVNLQGPLVVDNSPPKAAADGSISLPLWMADIHNEGYGKQARLVEDAGGSAITDWTDGRTRLAWKFETAAAGTYEIVANLEVASPGAKLKILGGTETPTTTLELGSGPVVIGRISVAAGGVHELQLQPIPAGWQSTVLRSLSLRPLAIPSQS